MIEVPIYTEKEMDDELELSENREEILDTMSHAIANFFCADIGEHSNFNDPWKNAIDMIKDTTLEFYTQTAVREITEEIKDLCRRNGTSGHPIALVSIIELMVDTKYPATPPERKES